MVSTIVVPYGLSRRVLYAVWRVECSVCMNSGTMTVFAAVHRPARENCVAQRSAAAWTATLHVYLGAQPSATGAAQATLPCHGRQK